MNFVNAQQAIAWADEMTLRPVCDTLLAKNFVRGGVGGYTPQEMRDIAHTITNYVYNMEKPVGLLFLSVYGVPEREGAKTVMEEIAVRLHQLPEGKTKSISKLQLLVGAVMESTRQKELYDKRLSRVKMAKFISVSRKTLNERGWPELEAEARKVVNQWLAIGEERIHTKLREWEWMV